MVPFADAESEDGAAISNAANREEDTMARAHGFVVSPDPLPGRLVARVASYRRHHKHSYVRSNGGHQ